MRKVVFVSDFFADQLVGGAELSIKALMETCPYEVIRLNSNEVDGYAINRLVDCFWVIGNFTQLKYTLLPLISAKLDYAVMEFDYKFCKYRNPQMHKFSEATACDCHKTFGKRIEDFYSKAKVIFWMSEAQRDIHWGFLPGMKETKNVVLSSPYADETLDYIKQLRIEARDKPRKGWIVTGHESWVKGFQNTVEYCKEKGIDPKIIYSMPYKELLRELSTAEGIIYMPNGEDTCPRLMTEAKLLGCKLVINDFVQQKNEAWFVNENLEEVDIFLRYRKFLFMANIKEAMGINDKEEVSL